MKGEKGGEVRRCVIWFCVVTNGSDELRRYHRQMLLPEIGEAGQRRLAASHALIVGCGALGTVSAEFLVRAGVGRVTIVDRDVVEETNLQRQVLFDETDAAAGTPKAEAARRKLAAINSTVDVRAVVADFNFTNAERIGGFEEHRSGDRCHQEGPGVIVDGTDNFETRYLLNDLAAKHAVPYVYAGAVGTSGTGFVVTPGKGPCLRCLYPDLPGAGSTATCDTAGVLGPLVGMVASWQAGEALKVLVGDEAAVSRRLWTWEPWRDGGDVRAIDVSAAHDSACPCCGARRFEFLEGRGASRATALCGRHAVQLTPAGTGGGGSVDLDALAQRLRAHGPVTGNEFLVRARLDAEPSEIDDPMELTVFRDGRTVVRGTSKPDVARGVYAKYVGS